MPYPAAGHPPCGGLFEAHPHCIITLTGNITMKVVTFGALMVRLQPLNHERFVQASNLEFTFGGG